MSHLHWNNLNDVFKKKPNNKDFLNFLNTISNKFNELFNIDKLSLNLVISIEKYSNDSQIIEQIIQENKIKINNFLTWLFTLLLIVNSKYIKREFAAEIKSSLTKIFDYVFLVNTNKAEHERIIVRTIYFILFWILVIESSGYLSHISKEDIQKKKKFAYIIGQFYNLNVDFLNEKPKLYWTYGKEELCYNFMMKNTQSNVYLVSDLNDWKTFQNVKHIYIKFDENTDIVELSKLINGNIFIGKENNENPIFIDEIYIISDVAPNKKLKINTESIFYFNI